MRYVILLAMLLLCLPVRGEAWQVVGISSSSCPSGLVLNGCFDDGNASWNPIIAVSNGAATLSNNGGTYATVFIPLATTITVGSEYYLSIDVVAVTNGGNCRVEDVSTVIISNKTVPGTYQVGPLIKQDGNFRIRIGSTNTEATCSFDNVKVWQ